MSVKLGQLIKPLRITISIGIARHHFVAIILHARNGKDIAVGVVGVFVTNVAVNHLDELTLHIIGIAERCVAVAVDRRDIAKTVVSVAIRIHSRSVYLCGITRNLRCGSVARKVLVRTLSGNRKLCRALDGLRGEPLQRIVRIGHRIDDAVRRDRHGADRAVLVANKNFFGGKHRFLGDACATVYNGNTILLFYFFRSQYSFCSV